MEKKYHLLDLFCGAGGAGFGYNMAGFKVFGVDINRQNNYPFEYLQEDVFNLSIDFFQQFDAIHASPPCQRYCYSLPYEKRILKPDLVEKTRKLLQKIGKPYIIENIPSAPLYRPITLCGSMFGLSLIRHRDFESSFTLLPYKKSCNCRDLIREKSYFTVTGNSKGNKKQWSDAMGIHWMTCKELTQAIPPKYTEFIGKQLLEYLERG